MRLTSVRDVLMPAHVQRSVHSGGSSISEPHLLRGDGFIRSTPPRTQRISQHCTSAEQEATTEESAAVRTLYARDANVGSTIQSLDCVKDWITLRARHAETQLYSLFGYPKSSNDAFDNARKKSRKYFARLENESAGIDYPNGLNAYLSRLRACNDALHAWKELRLQIREPSNVRLYPHHLQQFTGHMRQALGVQNLYDLQDIADDPEAFRKALQGLDNQIALEKSLTQANYEFLGMIQRHS